MKTAIIIPARKNSKRIPGKNIKELGGKPLIAWVIQTALKIDNADVWVSTDCKKIASVAKKYGAKVDGRSPHLARDETPTYDVILDFVKRYEEYELVAVVQATTPLQQTEFLKDAINKTIQTKKASIAVAEANYFLWDENGLSYDSAAQTRSRRRSQDWRIKMYKENGAFYVVLVKDLIRESLIPNPQNPNLIIMPKIQSIDIDTEEDWEMAELLCEKFL